jgi:hypothetical protein
VTVDTSLPDLYRGPINVWVEDVLTREYLHGVWGDPNVRFLIAASNEGISRVVEDARASGLRNVFGVADRDFARSNMADWNDPAKDPRRFIPPVHEMENYLLDAEALAETAVNNEKKSRAEIEGRMKERAGQLAWWMACRHVLWRIRSLCLDGFPAHPKSADISERASAVNYIVTNPWYARFPAGASDIGDAAKIEDWLAEAHAQYEQDLQTGAWRQTFSGKEIFRDVRTFVYHPKKSASPAQHDVDVAKTIAAWQLANDRIPPDLVNLLKSLRARVASPGASTSNAETSGPNP